MKELCDANQLEFLQSSNVTFVLRNYSIAFLCLFTLTKTHHVNQLQKKKKEYLPVLMGKERNHLTKSKPGQLSTNQNDWFQVSKTKSAILRTVWLIGNKTQINPTPFGLWRNIPVYRILWLSIQLKKTRLYRLGDIKLTSWARIARHFQRNEQFSWVIDRKLVTCPYPMTSHAPEVVESGNRCYF